MSHYYSTFPSGLSSVVQNSLPKTISNVKVLKTLDGLIEYSTGMDFDKIRSVRYFHNTFLVLNRIKTTKKAPLEAMINQVLKGGRITLNPNFINLRKGTFRVVTSFENKLTHVDKTLLSQLEFKIKKSTNLNISRSRPDFEFWVLYRSEGYVYFSLRLTKVSKRDNLRSKGELRPQLTHLLCLISEPVENELFLDPFCGSGTIPITRAYMSKSGLVYASDNNENTINLLKEKIKKLRVKKKLIVRQEDALNLRYDNESIHKIVTDPPWGLYDNGINVNQFYEEMLEEFYRIMKRGALAVLLVKNEEKIDQLIDVQKNKLKVLERYGVLVSGQKAKIYKLRKLE